jgi:hypothetical protein
MFKSHKKIKKNMELTMILILISTWTWNDAKPKSDRSSNLPDSYELGLST